MTNPKRQILWTGIDPTNVVLSHFDNDHYTTRATSETTYFSIPDNLLLLVYN